MVCVGHSLPRPGASGSKRAALAVRFLYYTTKDPLPIPFLPSETPSPHQPASSPRFPLPPPSHQPHQAPHPSASSSVCWQVDVTVVLTYGLWGFCPVRNDSLLSEYKCKHTQSQVHTCKHSRTYLLELARLHIHQHLTHTLCSIHVAFNPQ